MPVKFVRLPEHLKKPSVLTNISMQNLLLIVVLLSLNLEGAFVLGLIIIIEHFYSLN